MPLEPQGYVTLEDAAREAGLAAHQLKDIADAAGLPFAEVDGHLICRRGDLVQLFASMPNPPAGAWRIAAIAAGIDASALAPTNDIDLELDESGQFVRPAIGLVAGSPAAGPVADASPPPDDARKLKTTRLFDLTEWIREASRSGPAVKPAAAAGTPASQDSRSGKTAPGPAGGPVGKPGAGNDSRSGKAVGGPVNDSRTGRVKSPDSSTSKDPFVGETLGQYRLLKRLGRGGKGIVYEAEDLRIGRRVAVKVLPQDLVSADSELLQRFLLEARAAARIEHPNVVSIYTTGEERGIVYIAMSLVRGGSVQDRLQTDVVFPAAEASRIIRLAAAGLSAVHAAGIIHRDLKPGNIMLGEGGDVKISDFGMAKMTDNSVAGLTQDGTLLGTPQYMSPEQCLGKALDCRADLYSLGATYFRMLTGKPPFQDRNLMALVFKHVRERHPDPRTLNPAVPDACVRVIDRALAKEPLDRYATAEELAADLAAVERELKAKAAAEAAEDLVAIDDDDDTVDVTNGARPNIPPKPAGTSGSRLSGWLSLPAQVGFKLLFANVGSAQAAADGLPDAVRKIARVQIAPSIMGGSAVAILDLSVCLPPGEQLEIVRSLIAAGGSVLGLTTPDQAVEDWLGSRIARVTAR